MAVALFDNVCLLGPCGVGKTRLLCAMTDRYAPGEYSPTIEDNVTCQRYRMQFFDTAGTDSSVQGTAHLREMAIEACCFFIIVMPPRIGTDATQWNTQLANIIIVLHRMRGDAFHFILALGGDSFEWKCPAALTDRLIAVVPLDNAWTPRVCVQAIRACADHGIPSSSSSASPARERPRMERKSSIRKLSQQLRSSGRQSQSGSSDQ